MTDTSPCDNSGPLIVVVNAASGSSVAAERVGRVETRLGASGRDFELLVADRGSRITSIADRALALARERAGVLVVAGGDGTINAVGRLAVEYQVPFGVLPGGTFNYLSRALGIPQDLDAAINTLLEGVVRPVQAGLMNDRIFFVNASVGLYPQLLEDREAYKRRFGRNRLVAVWSALVTLIHQPRQLKIELDADGASKSVKTPTLFVGNNRLQMDQVGIVEGSLLETGRLVAITSQPLSISASLKLMVRGFLGRLGDAPEVDAFAFASLTMRTGRFGRKGRIKVAADGEIFRLRLPLLFKPSPKPLQIILPAVKG